MKILVAEDDTMFLNMVSEILTKAGHKVFHATNGKEALRKATTFTPDLIILDIVLPEMLGTEICESLRKSSRTAGIPVLLMTSSVAETAEGTFSQHFKADDFLRKPFDAAELLAKVKKFAGTTSRYAVRAKATTPVGLT
jgi:two-component system OmpR family response regulator